ncbi:hypothetical protein DYB32_000166 [Aphanomyces invadans]|uniref:CCD97-like C-terminal domain-containing protein n=1 Tax=Aphanomyces invadans TaxID=157072 RepID=A0A3R7AGL2_9STRA|nr:hypothetical protein DYB32_000166 [Aphanomyces invadans]
MEFQSRIDDDDEDAVLLEVETHSMRIVDNDDDDPLDAYMKTIETPGNLAVTFPRELPRPRRQIPPNARLTKNRRYQKLQELLHKSDYFSDENMELRNPGLFHLLLGNYLPAQAESSRPTADQSKLSEFLLASIQKRDLEERKAQEEDLWGR